VIFELLITTDAAEVTYEALTVAYFALVRSHCTVLLMSMFTLAWWPPHIYIKSFSSWKPPLTKLFWSPRNEFKLGTVAFFTIGFETFFCKLLFVMLKQVSTEASWKWTNSKTIFFCRWRSPCNVNTVSYCLLGVHKFPCKNLFSSWSRSNLLY